MNSIDLTRLSAIPVLDGGAHDDLSKGACVMEAVAYVAGEPWSDHPQCVCPVIGDFLRLWNDGLSDDERDTLLRPLISLVIGTRGNPALERRRAIMAVDWLVRSYTPAWLRLARLNTQASALENLPEITDFVQCPSLVSTLEAAQLDAAAAWSAARDAAWDAAKDAARDSVWDAAWSAAWSAARNAAWDAARDAARDAAKDAAADAAWSAVRDAAWNAAWDAARDAAKDAAGDSAGAAAWGAAWSAAWSAARDAAKGAARDAAGDAAATAAWDAAWSAAWSAARDSLNVTRLELQQSALKLVHRMIAAGDGT